MADDWVIPVLIPILLLIGGLIEWWWRSRIEEYREVERKLRETQTELYMKILEPFAKMFTDLKGRGPIEAVKHMTSYDYRKTSLQFNVFGSDDVLIAYHNMMQHIYDKEAGKAVGDQYEVMRLWGQLLLEIRKSVGNEDTELDNLDMLRGMIKDVDVMKPK